ncbi:MAG: hypothetical protein JWO37_688 [Acidimicrobiales bacterium]|jgi:hypothetical protein|nr:hypothetical protein [Acidimicrobiales bacterium]
MPSFRTGRVTAITDERAGLQRVEVDGEPAFVLTQLTGDVAVGDDVVVNTTAVELGLGSGGWHVVHWNLARREWREPGGGHVMKLRYTSLQADTGAFDEHDDAPGALDGMPVVVCSVHSQLAPVVVALRDEARHRHVRVAFVMTDGGALPLALSDQVAALRDRGLVDLTVTAGHAFGGDLEAVNVASGLAAARHHRADVAVVGPGPGLVGTGTQLGTTALDVVAAVDIAAAMGGQPVLALRMSSADRRDRHRGVSHHARTAMGLVARPEGVAVAVPAGEDDVELPVCDRRVVAAPDVDARLRAFGIGVTHMGRSATEDPLFFAAAAVAGVTAARMLD